MSALPGVSGSTGLVDGSSAEPMTAQVREGSLRRPETPGSVLGAAVPAAIMGTDDGTAAPSTLTERDASILCGGSRGPKRRQEAEPLAAQSRSVSVPGQLSINEAA